MYSLHAVLSVGKHLNISIRLLFHMAIFMYWWYEQIDSLKGILGQPFSF